ncbi:MAG: sigma-54-dependent Fis family transcriptional regulator, partial [Deltaproteobacteria bacterium]|nr:sigma-54-dependent Fis family transcriptional regulator [Deltaproteobacteria bacterium]
LIERSAASKSNILITGESGTGKELVARAVHDNSARSAQPFVTINCGGIPENLLESELFGYKKGAFTGAMRDKKGFLEIADSGTLFLDEVGELPLSLQVKLLRMVQEKTFTAVGGTEEIVVDVRFISATNKDLQKKVLEGTFREDLYYRLNVVNVVMPPLRERAEDIPLLVSYFMQKYSVEMEKEVREISSYALDCLMNYRFPGNVRELENIIERGIALEKTSIMLPDSLELSQAGESPGPQRGDNGMADYTIPPEGVMLEDLLAVSEKRFMQEALKMSKGSIKGAAKLLGLTFRSMRYRLEKLSMDVREFK